MFKYRPISIRYDLDISNLHETLTDGSLKGKMGTFDCWKATYSSVKLQAWRQFAPIV